MSKKPETKFKENTVAPFLKVLANTWFVKTQQRATRGTPDYLICVNGMFVALELKKDAREKPDPLQSYNLNRIIECKGIAMVAFPENWDEVSKVLTTLSDDSSLKGRRKDGH